MKATVRAAAALAFLTGATLTAIASEGVHAPNNPSPAASAAHHTEDGNKILQKVKDTMLGKTVRSVFTMTVEKPKDKRISKARLWMEGMEYAFIYYDAPAADKGTKFLRMQGNQLFMYQPKAEKTIRIAGSLVKSSAMDSDFSYEDLLRQSTIYDDYDAKVVGHEKVGSDEAIVLDLSLKANRPSYAKVKMWVHAKHFLPLKQEYYEGGQVVKTYTTQKYGDLGGRTVPTEFTFDDLRTKDVKTVITMQSMDFNKPIDHKIFSQSYLSRASIPQ